jgi:hypothetical protein
VLATGVPQPGGFSLGTLFDRDAAVLRDPAREAAVTALPIPHTIVRVARITDTPGGALLRLVRGGSGGESTAAVSREDVVAVLVAALSAPPTNSIAFQVWQRITCNSSFCVTHRCQPLCSTFLHATQVFNAGTPGRQDFKDILAEMRGLASQEATG